MLGVQPRDARRAAGRSNPFCSAVGVNDNDFIMWQRFGMLQKAYGSYDLAGQAKVNLARQRQQERYRLTCFEKSAAALAQAATSKAPKHMKTDVDRIVFGRDHDRSEAADNALLHRLQRPRPASAMPALGREEQAAAKVHGRVGQLDVGSALGASRPSAVRPRPSSGGRLTHIMAAQRGTPEFRAEMEKQRRKVVLAWANAHSRAPPLLDAPGVPNPNAFHTTRR